VFRGGLAFWPFFYWWVAERGGGERGEGWMWMRGEDGMGTNKKKKKNATRATKERNKKKIGGLVEMREKDKKKDRKAFCWFLYLALSLSPSLPLSESSRIPQRR